MKILEFENTIVRPDLYNLMQEIDENPDIQIPMHGSTEEVAAAFIKKAAFMTKEPTTIAATKEFTIKTSVGDVSARAYYPTVTVDKPMPTIVYYHGGCWMFCNVDTHDELCKQIALGCHAVVLSVDYSLAPEYKYPHFFTECDEAYRWAVNNVYQLGHDSEQIIIAGDSAGGCLAAGITLKARDESFALPKAQILFCPATDITLEDNLPYFARSIFESIVDSDDDHLSPYYSPFHAKNHKNLPPAIIMTAEYDEWRLHGARYAHRLILSGTTTYYFDMKEMVHSALYLATGQPFLYQDLQWCYACLRHILSQA